VKDCADCGEIVAAARWMRALTQGQKAPRDLPDAKLVWWAAQLSEQHAQIEKQRSAVGLLEAASGAAVPLGLSVWIAWHWFAIQGEAMKILVGFAPGFAPAAVGLAVLTPALLLLGAMALAYPILVRE
jgi:hypothetical protein